MHPTVITHKICWYQHLVLWGKGKSEEKSMGLLVLPCVERLSVPCVANCQFKRANKARTLLAIHHYLHAFTNNITLPRPELCLRTTLVFLFGRIKNRKVDSRICLVIVPIRCFLILNKWYFATISHYGIFKNSTIPNLSN